jgi:hypothetical protein
VRRQVALSLRRARTPEAEETLFDLMGDAQTSVGITALQSFGEGAVSAGDLDHLTSSLGTPALPGVLHEALLSVVAEHLGERDAATALLQKVIATSIDPHTRERARMLLAQVGGA